MASLNLIWLHFFFRLFSSYSLYSLFLFKIFWDFVCTVTQFYLYLHFCFNNQSASCKSFKSSSTNLFILSYKREISYRYRVRYRELHSCSKASPWRLKWWTFFNPQTRWYEILQQVYHLIFLVMLVTYLFLEQQIQMRVFHPLSTIPFTSLNTIINTKVTRNAKNCNNRNDLLHLSLASLLHFQYFRRPICNPVEHLWCSFFAKIVSC